jgi:hypothetical protein
MEGDEVRGGEGNDGVRVVVDPLFWPAGQVEAGGCFFLLGLHPKTL